MKVKWLLRAASVAIWGFGLGLGIRAPGAAEYVPIQERAQGQSLGGASLLNDSLYSNPASSTFTRVYSVAADLLMPKTFDVSILDTKTSDMGGALGYFQRVVPSSTKALQGAKLALFSRASGNWGMGIAGKMIWGPDLQGNDAKFTDLDAGFLGNFESLQLGFSVRNVFGGNMALDQGREMTLGARINYNQTLFLSGAAISKVNQVKPYQYGIGAEFVSPYYFAIKGGYYFQPGQPVKSFTGGLSFISPRVSFHYAVEFPNQADQKIEHQLGMTMLF